MILEIKELMINSNNEDIEFKNGNIFIKDKLHLKEGLKDELLNAYLLFNCNNKHRMSLDVMDIVQTNYETILLIDSDIYNIIVDNLIYTDIKLELIFKNDYEYRYYIKKVNESKQSNNLISFNYVKYKDFTKSLIKILNLKLSKEERTYIKNYIKKLPKTEKMFLNYILNKYKENRIDSCWNKEEIIEHCFELGLGNEEINYLINLLNFTDLKDIVPDIKDINDVLEYGINTINKVFKHVFPYLKFINDDMCYINDDKTVEINLLENIVSFELNDIYNVNDVYDISFKFISKRHPYINTFNMEFNFDIHQIENDENKPLTKDEKCVDLMFETKKDLISFIVGCLLSEGISLNVYNHNRERKVYEMAMNKVINTVKENIKLEEITEEGEEDDCR